MRVSRGAPHRKKKSSYVRQILGYERNNGIYSQYNSQCPSRLTGRVRRPCDAEKNEIKFWRRRLWQQEMQTRLWWCLWWCLRLAGVWGQAVRFCVGAFGRNLDLVAVKMFSHLIDFIKKLYKCCTFNTIWKDNAAINCITVQHKKKFHSRQLWRVMLR
jgi:hypothetical protein